MEVNALVKYLGRYDFLTYPFYTRYGDMSYSEYCLFVENSIKSGKTGDDLERYVRDIELANSTDIFIRVFMDEKQGKALIMGWIDKIKMFSPPKTHKLILPGKSELPLYFVKSLSEGNSLTTIDRIFE